MCTCVVYIVGEGETMHWLLYSEAEQQLVIQLGGFLPSAPNLKDTAQRKPSYQVPFVWAYHNRWNLLSIAPPRNFSDAQLCLGAQLCSPWALQHFTVQLWELHRKRLGDSLTGCCLEQSAWTRPAFGISSEREALKNLHLLNTHSCVLWNLKGKNLGLGSLWYFSSIHYGSHMNLKIITLLNNLQIMLVNFCMNSHMNNVCGSEFYLKTVAVPFYYFKQSTSLCIFKNYIIYLICYTKSEFTPSNSLLNSGLFLQVNIF